MFLLQFFIGNDPGVTRLSHLWSLITLLQCCIVATICPQSPFKALEIYFWWPFSCFVGDVVSACLIREINLRREWLIRQIWGKVRSIFKTLPPCWRLEILCRKKSGYFLYLNVLGVYTEWKLWNAILSALRWVDMESRSLSLGFCTYSPQNYILLWNEGWLCFGELQKNLFSHLGSLKLALKLVRQGGGWRGSVRVCVSVGVGSSSFSATFPQSPRLASLGGTAGGPKSCQQSILSRLACWVWYTPLTPASRSPAAGLVPLAFRMQCCCRSPSSARQPCRGTWPAVLMCPLAGPGSCDTASPQGSPQAAPWGTLPVRLQGQQNTNWRSRSHLLPEEGYHQHQTTSAMALLMRGLKISWPRGCQILAKKINWLVLKIKHKSLVLLQS